MYAGATGVGLALTYEHSTVAAVAGAESEGPKDEAVRREDGEVEKDDAEDSIEEEGEEKVEVAPDLEDEDEDRVGVAGGKAPGEMSTRKATRAAWKRECRCWRTV